MKILNCKFDCALQMVENMEKLIDCWINYKFFNIYILPYFNYYIIFMQELTQTIYMNSSKQAQVPELIQKT